MKKIILLLLLPFSLFAQIENSTKAEKLKNDFNEEFSKQKTAVFEENKGQMKDQHWQARPDVLFYGKSEGMNYYIRNNGISYQLSRVESWKDEEDIMRIPNDKNKRKVPDQIGTYRVDAAWLGNNLDYTIEKGKELPVYNNYYNVPDGIEPALFVKQYEAITLKNLWNGIDIHYYSTDGFLETDYLVSPGADYRQIQMEIKGADLSIDSDGYLIMKTPFGEIREGKLKVYQNDEQLVANWIIEQKSEKHYQVSFEIPDYNPALAMRIDPIVRVWGTYYGGFNNEIAEKITTDDNKNIYLSGRTNGSLGISSGGHQNSYGGGIDVFLVKLNSSGNRIWATYYGGMYDESYSSCSADKFNCIYLTGTTYYSQFQSSDAFIAKFDSLGIRLWSGGYGGTGYDYCYTCTNDLEGNVYMAGLTLSQTNISYLGFQNSISYPGDAFLVKFDSSGQRLWATYYGSWGGEVGYSCTTDNNGNVYMAGIAPDNPLPGGVQWNYPNYIASNNAHQGSGGGSVDAFLVKFDGNGVRKWGTYYGGSNNDYGYSCTTDLDGNVYLSGITNSPNAIAMNGHQNALGGNDDAFIVKFDSLGNRIWGTYYGGNNAESSGNCITDKFGDVYLSGSTYSDNNISFNGYQDSIFTSFSSIFLAKINNQGQRIWGTYYGSQASGGYLALDDNNNIYLSGSTNSPTGISNLGFQNNNAGGNDAFLVKFSQPKISGYVWNDLNNNCNREQNEAFSINGIRLRIDPGNYFTETKSGFWYIDSLPAGNYTVTVDTSNNNWIPTCTIVQSFTVPHPDSSVIAPNFGFVAAYPCASPDVSIVMPIMRRGFPNQQIFIQACNRSTATGRLDSAYTIIELPSEIVLQSASIPYSSLGNRRYRFNLGNMNPDQCINFTINATVTIQAIANQTLCISAELFPQATCVFDSIPTPYQDTSNTGLSSCATAWDRSSLFVQGTCIGDSVRFVIYNTGNPFQGNMSCFAPVRFYLNDRWLRFDSIQLAGGDSVVYTFAGNSGTWRLEADQHPLHPGNSHPNAFVENCGNGTWTAGTATSYPQDDADPVIDIYCGQVTAPLDPNDKTGFPNGVGSINAIRQNQQIEYLIRFQNVGTDTAFNVVIRDTLSADFNIFTLDTEVSSHPYDFKMYGQRVLEWRFSNIMLPDSNTNEPASHGFVKFTVSQNPNLPFGTIISNNASIYFDFEAPIVTNTYNHTIYNFAANLPQPSFSSVIDTACELYTINGQNFVQTGTYRQVLTNFAGYDSIITVNLTIKQASDSTISLSACNSYNLNGQIYNQTGTYTQTRQNSIGCDSIITLNLNILQPSNNTITEVACLNYSLNGITFNQSGNYTQVSTNAAGCDSIITLNLTILQPTINSITESSCNSYSLNGQTYTQSGTYSQILTNAAGCDSTITLNLTILQPSNNVLTETACSNYTLNGQTYNQTGTYFQTIPNAAGCDSTITLNLTILQPSNNLLTETACNTFTLNGQTYNQSGTYTQTIPNTVGCDSTITLNLTINQASINSINASACDSFTLNAQTYYSTGIYSQTLLNTQGCDSTLTLNLSVNQIESVTITSTNTTYFGANDGSIDLNVTGSAPFSFLWSNGSTTEDLTAVSAGTYTVTITDVNGCTIEENITINQPPVTIDLTSNKFIVNLFPNPAEDQALVAIELDQATNVRIRLINSLGQVLQTAEYGNTSNVQHSLNLNSLSSAIYLVEILANNSSKTLYLNVLKR